MTLTDKLFKWLALLVACGYLWVYWQSTNNGRFALTHDGETVVITDSRTGRIYAASQGIMAEVNLITGSAKRTNQPVNQQKK